MEFIFIILTVLGLLLEVIGIVGIIKEQFKESNQRYALKFLVSGFACHIIAFTVSYIS